MAATDRNVLRLGAYEILHTDTPARVAINEAVELAKRFGTAQSPQFVNGILDRFLGLRRDRPEDERPTDEHPQTSPAVERGAYGPGPLLTRHHHRIVSRRGQR